VAARRRRGHGEAKPARQGEEREIEVETIDRYRYFKLDATY
jgi:hypothetical protein